MIRSLRLRLLAGAVVAISIALGIAWCAMTLLFERHIQRRTADDLIREARPLLAQLALLPSGTPSVGLEPRDDRFQTPLSGYYWQASTARGMVASRSLWDARMPASQGAVRDAWTSHVAQGPFGKPLFLVERLVRPQRNQPDVLVQLAADAGSLNAARDEFGRELALFLALLGGVLLAAAWAQVALGLRPLGRVRAELDRLKRDPAARLGRGYPQEIEILTSAIDALAEAREGDLRRATRRAADLAHGMKTPLAALKAQSRRAREAGAAEAADGLDRAINAVSDAVSTELARTRLMIASSGAQAETRVQAIAERIAGVVERTEQGESLLIEVEVGETLAVPLAESDLSEILGPLIENAARHARRRVRISGERDSATCWVAVEDDGAGMARERMDEAVLRGARFDQAGNGHGLGLSIARDLVEASGGSLSLDHAALGGLAIRLRWPLHSSP